MIAVWLCERIPLTKSRVMTRTNFTPWTMLSGKGRQLRVAMLTYKFSWVDTLEFSRVVEETFVLSFRFFPLGSFF